MSPSPAQDAAFRELAQAHDAVAQTPLPTGEVSIVARDGAGVIHAAVVIDRKGDELEPHAVVSALGHTRSTALRLADTAADHLIAHLALRAAAGEALPMTELAHDARISRQTLYSRLEDVQAQAPPAAAA